MIDEGNILAIEISTEVSIKSVTSHNPDVSRVFLRRLNSKQTYMIRPIAVDWFVCKSSDVRQITLNVARVSLLAEKDPYECCYQYEAISLQEARQFTALW